MKNAGLIGVEKSKIDIKFKRKNDHRQASVHLKLSVKRDRVVTSAETRLHASFPRSADLF